MQHKDQWDDTGASKYHTEMLLVWIELIQKTRNQIKFSQPLLASTCMLVLVMAFGRSWVWVLRLAFEQSTDTFEDHDERGFFQQTISEGLLACLRKTSREAGV